jgi:hypothetical protein
MSVSSSRSRIDRRIQLLCALIAALPVLSCDADLREVRNDRCLLEFNGICDAGTLCNDGDDAADCLGAPYGACHTLIGAFSSTHCESFEYCIVSLQGFPLQESVCAPACIVDEDCPESAESGFEYACIQTLVEDSGNFSTPINLVNACVVTCDETGVCPENMICGTQGHCVWRSEER